MHSELLQHVSFKHLDDTAKSEAIGLAELMADAVPTEFALEGAAVHFLRSVRVLEGMAFDLADLEARCVAIVALRRAGARRPAWADAQPIPLPRLSHTCKNCGVPLYNLERDWCSHRCAVAVSTDVRAGKRLAERMNDRCTMCGAPLHSGMAGKIYCSERCQQRGKHAKGMEFECAWCKTKFLRFWRPSMRVPKFCSHPCRHSKMRADGVPVPRRRMKALLPHLKANSLECRATTPARLPKSEEKRPRPARSSKRGRVR